MKRRNVLISIGLIIVLLLATSVGWYIFKNRNSQEEKPKEIKKLDTIEGYGYNLEDRDTVLFRENFEKLRDVLKQTPIDYLEYAKRLGTLYIIDLYTISNKVNQYDVGGSEYVYESKRDNYELKVKNTLYKYVEDNTYGKRIQFLPEVASIDVVDVKEEKVKIGDQEYDGYSLSLSWEYVKDLGYDTKCILKLAKIDDKLYVINQSTSET
ncbi:MAG: hypothetical protein HFG33_01685 [Bacilli bacterium]|nr:hypothetical protein [Bacilli bacterium]